MSSAEARRAQAQNARVLEAARSHGRHTVTVAAPLPSPAGALLAETLRRHRSDDPAARVVVPDLVADGLGVSVVPASFAVAGFPRLAFVPVPGLVNPMSVLWRRDETAPAVLAFVAACRAAGDAVRAARPDVWSAAD